MILLGKNITLVNDQLVKFPVLKIYHALRNPNSDTQSKIRQLRIVRALDIKRYNSLKRQLPYIVCGIFSPPYRRSENFAYIEYFILDIDKITEKGLSVNDLKRCIISDSRVLMAFVSPSEDGLKVMFKLSERCYDKGKYALFYKAFAHQFARQYQIEQVIDWQTCDVTRACFVSMDPDVYYNANADNIQMSDFISENNPQEMYDLRFALEHQDKNGVGTNNDSCVEQSSEKSETKEDVDASVIAAIKAILHPKAVQPQKQVWVPEQLNDIMGELTAYITKTGVEITEIINISYGKKIRMKIRLKQAEVNLFYGKRGFSVVKSPRSGTDNELNEMMVSLIKTFLLM